MEEGGALCGRIMEHIHSPAPPQAGAPISSPFLQFRGQLPTRRVRIARPAGGAGAGPGLWGRDRSWTHPAGVAEAMASAMVRGDG